MAKCQFTTKYWNNESKAEVDYNCPDDEETLGSGLCIFHDEHYLQDNNNRKEHEQKVRDRLFVEVNNSIDRKEALLCIGYYLPNNIWINGDFEKPAYFSKAKFHGVDFSFTEFSGGVDFSFTEFYTHQIYLIVTMLSPTPTNTNINITGITAPAPMKIIWAILIEEALLSFVLVFRLSACWQRKSAIQSFLCSGSIPNVVIIDLGNAVAIVECTGFTCCSFAATAVDEPVLTV